MVVSLSLVGLGIKERGRGQEHDVSWWMFIDKGELFFGQRRKLIFLRQTIPEAGFLLKVAEKVQKMAK